MDIRVVTLFPEMVAAGTGYGVCGRAIRHGLVRLGTVNPRDFSADVHRTVDDRPYGGGPGMVLKAEPFQAAIAAARERLPDACPVIFLTPQGRRFDQAVARQLAARPGFVLVAGRYEGFDERLLAMEADDEISLGDFVLSGGEVAAAAVIDAVVRLLPGALGDDQSAEQDSFSDGLLDCPHYTRPEILHGRQVPKVLLEGNHEAIRQWRLKQALGRTSERRPDLLAKRELTAEETRLLEEYLAAHEAASEGEH
jgi:tRNA (guanine37-N1)-methyltransferase